MKILSGWKEIAVYLGSSVRTAQRWERDEGLPVQRHHHRTGGSVYAVPSQIEHWRRRRSVEITERIRGEFGRQVMQLHTLAERQKALAEELRRVVASTNEIWTLIGRQRKK